MSDIHNLKGFKRACEKRKSLEEKTRVFEENARVAKLSIDKQLLRQVLQEMNHAHDATVKELEEKLQEENRTHEEAIKEVEEKIADLDQQTKRLSKVGSIPSEMPSEPMEEIPEPEPAQEIPESPQELAEPKPELAGPSQEISTEVDQSVRARELQERVRELLQDSKQSESEVPPEVPKKKKRGLF